MNIQAEPALRAGPTRRVWLAFGALVAALAVVVAVVIATRNSPDGVDGQLSEVSPLLPAAIELPAVADAGDFWGLDAVRLEPAHDQMAGGVAVADLDGDDALDLVVANGEVAVMLWRSGGYGPPRTVPGIADAIGVSATDVDLDGSVDLLVARAGDEDSIVWGGPWLDVGGQQPATTALASAGPSSGLLAGELTGDHQLDVVRLGRGSGDTPQPDVLWQGELEDPRAFTPEKLPVADRFSLAGELLDADGDGLLDIWITRDVGWARGPDSVLSRRGDPTGAWTDIAPELGADLAIDGMGITITDLDGDERLDAYISDLGDNELLRGTDDGFVSQTGSGAAHIRPRQAGADIVSSSWGTGATDLNLDGVVDLVVASGGFPGGAVRNKIEGTTIAVTEAPALLVGHGDGRFTDVWGEVGVSLEVTARGLAVADLDGDGDDDVVIAQRDGTVAALRNDSRGASVSVSVASACPTAGVTVTVGQAGHVIHGLLAPHGYASSHAAGFVTGLSDDMPVSIVVRWPSGGSASAELEPGGGRRSVEVACDVIQAHLDD